MISRGTAPSVTVYRMQCECGFWASSLNHDRMKAAMLDHLTTGHGKLDLPGETPVVDTEEVP